MASIETRLNKDGTYSYQANIRKKGITIYKTFDTEEDAKIYSWYKEKLIDNMDNFEVPIKERVTFEQIIELKINSINQEDRRTLNDFKMLLNKYKDIFKNKFLHQLKLEDWIELAKKMFSEPVYKGAKTKNGKRDMSPITLKKHFANISAAFSYAQKIGIALENLPLHVIRSYITNLIDKSKRKEE